MDDYAHIHELWTQHDYTGVLSIAWSLPATDNYLYFRSAVRLQDLSLSELVRRACQQAVSSSVSNQFQQPSLTARAQSARWVEDLLDDFSPPAALVDHSDGDEAEAFRSHMLRAHLLCVSLALQLQEEGRLAADVVDPHPDSEDTLAALLFKPAAHHFQHLSQETDLPLVFFRDLLATLLPENKRHSRPSQSEPSVSLTALLVGKTQRQGIVATLSLEQRSGGNGLCYPTPDLAFVRRDLTFRAAERNACTYVKDAGLWKADQDVCWRVERRDGQPITTLTGSSMGFAFALGLAKLFAST
jgi:hypothetical protein